VKVIAQNFERILEKNFSFLRLERSSATLKTEKRQNLAKIDAEKLSKAKKI